jgi:hypothetical protein
VPTLGSVSAARVAAQVTTAGAASSSLHLVRTHEQPDG